MRSTSKAVFMAGGLALGGLISTGADVASAQTPGNELAPLGSLPAPALSPGGNYGLAPTTNPTIPSGYNIPGYSTGTNTATVTSPRGRTVGYTNPAAPPTPSPNMPGSYVPTSGQPPLGYNSHVTNRPVGDIESHNYGAPFPSHGRASFPDLSRTAYSPATMSGDRTMFAPRTPPMPSTAPRQAPTSMAAPGSYWNPPGTDANTPPKRKSLLSRFATRIFDPGRNSSDSSDTENVPSSYRDPATGLNFPVSKPWMKPQSR